MYRIKMATLSGNLLCLLTQQSTLINNNDASGQQLLPSDSEMIYINNDFSLSAIYLLLEIFRCNWVYSLESVAGKCFYI